MFQKFPLLGNKKQADKHQESQDCFNQISNTLRGKKTPFKSLLRGASSILFISLVAVSGCQKPPAPPAMPPMPVQTVVLHQSPIEDSSKYIATLKSRKSVTFGSEFTAYVQEIYVRSGDKVPAGKLLIKLRSNQEESSVKAQNSLSQAKAELVSASKQSYESYKAKLREAEANLKLAKNQYQRYEALFKEQMVSKNQLEQYENNLTRASQEYESIKSDMSSKQFSVLEAENNYKQASSQINEKKAIVEKLRVVAPFAGTVGDIPVKVGDSVYPQAQLLSLANIDQLEVYINVPADKISRLKIGSKVTLVDASGNSSAESEVFFISPTVSSDSQTVLVKALLNNPQGVFRDGQQIDCKIHWGEKMGILLPTPAISRFGTASFVFKIQRDGKKTSVKQTPVQLDGIQQNAYEVLSGLSDGDEIVLEGIQKLGDGSPVTILPPNQAPAKGSK